ncbi:MAG: hypothetical protein K8R88_11665 [Armatimonadetes bacterium]|nr:hypothetical protein [Armatimonadota bacterium]
MVEAMVAVALLAIGITACLGALGAMTKGEARAQESERLQLLAHRKLNELIATREAETGSASGDFSASGFPSITWAAETETSGVENLDALYLTVTEPNKPDLVLTHVVFRKPTTTEGAAN